LSSAALSGQAANDNSKQIFIVNFSIFIICGEYGNSMIFCMIFYIFSIMGKTGKSVETAPKLKFVSWPRCTSHPRPYIEISPFWACLIMGDINGDKFLWKSLPEPTLLPFFRIGLMRR